jgi:hypothetical protein
MRPETGQVLHFSEDPDIRRFTPHVAATAKQPDAYVWAVDHRRSPDYWFPRQCPRAMAWTTATTSPADAGWLGAARVHAIEYGWLPALQSVTLYAYRFDAADFTELDGYAHVATKPVTPLGPAEPVGDLLRLHEAAGIELRLVDNLWPWWRQVTVSTLGFSGIRLANSRPAPAD